MSLLDFPFTDHERDECLKLCNQFLGSEWTDLVSENAYIEPIKGGVCNRIFLCVNKNLADSKNDQKVPSKVVIRLYGNSFVGERGDMIGIDDSAIAIICNKLEMMDMGPKIYGVFNKGRIEEYIAHDKIDQKIKQQPDFINILSRKIAFIHSWTMPIPKDSNFILDLSLKFYKQATGDLEKRLSELEPEDLENFNLILSINVKKEVEWLKHTAPKIQSRSVYCHNDLKFQNIGLRKDKEKLEDRVFIFDYENCSYNYRGYDLAFFLNCYDFLFSFENKSDIWRLPSQELIDQVIDEYLKEWKKLSKNFDPTIDNRDHMIMEVDFCVLMVHLLYSCVLLKRVEKSFMYFARRFGRCLNGTYFDSKKKFLKKYSSLLKI